MINVMIADDQELIRESLKIVLDQNVDMQVTALAEHGRQLMEILEQEMAQQGELIFHKREDFVKAIVPIFQEIYEKQCIKLFCI